MEPFRNPSTPQEIGDCLVKILEIRRHLWREANRNNTDIEDSNLARLWIFTPTASESVLSGFGAIIDNNWLPGVYFMPSYFRTAIVVIHQLPRTSETLWLRILGKGTVQKKAIDELEALPANNPFRKNALTILNRLKSDLQITSNDPEDQELIMRLSPLFDQQLEEAKQEGQRRVIESVLRSRFGELDSQLAVIIDPILAIPPEESTPLLLQLSREELVARFTP